MGEPFFVYMLLCSDASYYVGHTDDLDRRFAEHQAGFIRGYTYSRRPVKLAWSQEFATRLEAKEVEAWLKKWSRAKKEALVKGDYRGLHALAKKADWQSYQKRQKQRHRARG